MSAIARIPIDLCDTRVPLPEALKVFEEFTAEDGQKHFQDDKRRTVYVSNLVYVALNGYLPRDDEITDNQGTRTIKG